MLPEPTIVAAATKMLGREPNDGERHFLRSAANEQEMRLRLASLPDYYMSPEVKRGQEMLAHERLKAPKLDIGLDVPPYQLTKLFDATEQAWLRLGKEDPYWSVVATESFRKFRMNDDLVRDFYRSADDEIAIFDHWLSRNGVEKPRHLLELGCGLGRMTRSFAKSFQRVTAIDISLSHLAIARREAAATNVEYRLMHRMSDYGALSGFDCFYSLLVLQHSPPPISLHILKTILRALAPGGIACFQVPTYIAGYSFAADAYLATIETRGMEMHCIPQAAIFAAMAECDISLLEAVNDGSGDHRFEIMRFFGRKAP